MQSILVLPIFQIQIGAMLPARLKIEVYIHRQLSNCRFRLNMFWLLLLEKLQFILIFSRSSVLSIYQFEVPVDGRNITVPLRIFSSLVTNFKFFLCSSNGSLQSLSSIMLKDDPLKLASYFDKSEILQTGVTKLTFKILV